MVILHLVHERSLGKDAFWHPYFKLLRTSYNNIMGLTEPQMKTLLRRCVLLWHGQITKMLEASYHRKKIAKKLASARYFFLSIACVRLQAWM